MADLNALQQKYAPVIQTIKEFEPYGAKVDGTSLDGEKLVLKAEVPSKVVANRVWDVIKQVDPNYPDLEHQISTTGGDAQPYTIKSGDNLSKIRSCSMEIRTSTTRLQRPITFRIRIGFRRAKRSMFRRSGDKIETNEKGPHHAVLFFWFSEKFSSRCVLSGSRRERPGR